MDPQIGLGKPTGFVAISAQVAPGKVMASGLHVDGNVSLEELQVALLLFIQEFGRVVGMMMKARTDEVEKQNQKQDEKIVRMDNRPAPSLEEVRKGLEE